MHSRAADFLKQEYAMCNNCASEITSARMVAANVVKFFLNRNYMDDHATFARNIKIVGYHHRLASQL